MSASAVALARDVTTWEPCLGSGLSALPSSRQSMISARPGRTRQGAARGARRSQPSSSPSRGRPTTWKAAAAETDPQVGPGPAGRRAGPARSAGRAPRRDREDLIDPHLRESCPQVVVAAARDAAGRDQEVGGLAAATAQEALEGAPGGRCVVGHRLLGDDQGAGRARLSGDPGAVRVVHGEGRQLGSRWDELAAAAEDRHAGAADAADGGMADGGHCPDGVGGDDRPGGEQHLPPPNDLPALAHVPPSRDPSVEAQRPVLLARVLETDDRVGTVGHRPSGRDPHGLGAREPTAPRRPCSALADDARRCPAGPAPGPRSRPWPSREAREVNSGRMSSASLRPAAWRSGPARPRGAAPAPGRRAAPGRS